MVSVVSVLCGAGGGLTVHPAVKVISAAITATTRKGPGTPFSVSAGSQQAQASVVVGRSLAAGEVAAPANL